MYSSWFDQKCMHSSWFDQKCMSSFLQKSPTQIGALLPKRLIYVGSLQSVWVVRVWLEVRMCYIRTMNTFITNMHVCMHACIHTCIRTYIHAYVHTYMRTYIHACMLTHIHTNTTNTDRQIDSQTYIHTYTCVYVCAHTYIHKCMICKTPYIQSKIPDVLKSTAYR